MSTKLLTLLALLFAMIFPTVAAWSYFLGLAIPSGGVNPRQQAAYVLAKVIQFSFPLAFLIFLGWRARKRRRRQRSYAQHAQTAELSPKAKDWEVSLDSGWRDPPSLQLCRPRFPGLKPALIFGLAVAVVMIGVYFGVLRGTSLLARTPAMLRGKLQAVNIDTPSRYVALAVFVVAAHSLLEEYYWRWFVFGGLRQFLSLLPAMLLSSLAFMAHHVVVLYVYLPGRFWTAVLPFSLTIAVGGAVWAWLYERNGSIWAPWLSHLLIDAGIFVIGWDLLWPISV
ncbi:MAG TPA: CPBP family intramembrane glutamic endopeptidase [Gemmataceae bacterium]|nr:CPBP family intramembrane glutamic endopeptidase [Gemmataceae bacterium]